MRTMTLLLLLLAARLATAQELGMTIKLDETGRHPDKVIISGRMEKAGWLGVSFYPYGAQNVLADGLHQVLQVPIGRFEHGFKVADRMLGGSVEAALWERKVPAAQCPGPCQWCKKNGYHLENQMLYLYGSLAQSAAKGAGR